MGSFVRFKFVRERTHVSGTFSRFANSFESITSVSLSCIGVASLRFRFELARGYKQMEWARVEKPKREWIKGQWVKGKSCDTFAPLGPFLVTRDEVADPHNLRLWLKVNGEVLQDANTSDLIFDVPTLVSYLSEFMTLLPGDVISTGTPAGVGIGFKPPRFLHHGDVVELGIDSLGSSRQRAVAHEGSLTSSRTSLAI